MESLPRNYLNQMKELLKEETDSYLKSLEGKAFHGLRVNTSKITAEDFLKIAPFPLRKIPWTDDGFYYEEECRPAKHPYYFAGLYYLQEPSAMLPAQILPVEKGDMVLDCCAAPGGKSSKLANKLAGSGLLIANDISVSRSQVLLKTLESQGVSNAYVTAQDICAMKGFDLFFDKILIDAPCSGQGMFRKQPSLIASYKEKDSSFYAPLQKQILSAAVRMLKPGGKLLYSTCTFAKEENEEVIEYALSCFPDLEVLPFEKNKGFESGLSENTFNCVRLYPHRIEGEGHFAALLQKKGKGTKQPPHPPIVKEEDQKKIPEDLRGILKNGDLIKRGDRFYLLPPYELETSKLRVLRSGLYLGEEKHGRFKAAHSLALALNPQDYPNRLDLSSDDGRTIRYLKCETLNVADFPVEGLVLVCVDGFPLGFGEVKNGILKNRYPANYRYQ